LSNPRSAGSPAQRRRSRGFRRASAGRATDSPTSSRLARFFVDRADEFIAWISPDARLLYGNPAICHALDYSSAEFSSLRAWDIFPTIPETWPAQFAEMKAGPDQVFTVEMHTRTGSILPARARMKYVACDGNEYLLCQGHDQLPGRLLELQDEERRRIARELHDATGQNLSALSIGLSMVLASNGLDPRAREVIKESLALADSCVQEIRTMSYLLHPPLLDELGLASALRAYSEGYSERTGIQLELNFPPHMPRLAEAIEIALFRIVQEGLTNIHRHSGSPTAILRLQHETGQVELELADRGRGLSPGTLDGDMPSASRIGVGIAGMRERARQLGGRLTIASGETGTTLRVVLPATSSTA
jgi:hypothetical protein